jgi:hypothetical protein
MVIPVGTMSQVNIINTNYAPNYAPTHAIEKLETILTDETRQCHVPSASALKDSRFL